MSKMNFYDCYPDEELLEFADDRGGADELIHELAKRLRKARAHLISAVWARHTHRAGEFTVRTVSHDDRDNANRSPHPARLPAPNQRDAN